MFHFGCKHKLYLGEISPYNYSLSTTTSWILAASLIHSVLQNSIAGYQHSTMQKWFY